MDETAMTVCKEKRGTTVAPHGDLDTTTVHAITLALRHLLADVFVLYLKTKSFHWHMTGRASATIPFFSTSRATN
ncbi:hypothetical protein BH10ACI4_BH10ACI4_07720 [soil metagenome]